MKKYTVQIDGHETRVKFTDEITDEFGELRPVTEKDALDRAIHKIYGKDCFWWADSGLPWYYGQVCRPVGINSNTCVTSRVRADITEGW